MKKLIGLIFSTLFIASSLGYAQSKERNTSLLEAKSRLEELIGQRLRSTIATTLDKNAFDISVSIKLVPAPPKKTLAISPEVRERTEGTLDLTVGLIDADSLIRKYEDEIKELKNREALYSSRMVAEDKPEFIVKSIEVFVGLDAAFGDEYAKELEGWIQNRLTPDFGKAIKTNVSLLKTAPLPTISRQTPIDILTKFQSLLGYALLAFAVILGTLLMKFLSSKDAKEQRKLTAQLQQSVKSADEAKQLTPVMEENKKPLLEAPTGPTAHELEAIRELHGKIIWSSSGNLDNLNGVIHGWLETGDRGLIKTACLMDVLISVSGRKESTGRGFNLEWDKVIPNEFQKKMRDTFEEMARLSAGEKISTLEEVYWDLVSVKTLGAQSLSVPFQYVSAIPAHEVRNLLAAQQPQIRAMVVLHMPEEAREDYMRRLPLEDKREIVEQTLQMEKVLSTDIETASETLKYAIKKQDVNTKVISLKSLAPKLLESVSIVDEIMLLRDISQKLSDGGNSIKRSFPSLAYVSEWPEKSLKLIFNSASSDEVQAFLRLMPELSSQILPLCAPRVQTIAGDDLRKEDSMSIEMKERHLSSLKLRMLQVLNTQGLNLEEVFPEVESTGGLRAAS